MHSDSFSTNASTIIPMPSCNSKEFTKKKRVNRSAKLKQCKLDARREQWLSHLKKKESVVETDTGKSGGSMLHTTSPTREERSRAEKEIDDGSMHHHYSDSESSATSPASHLSSVLGGNGSRGTIFTGSSSRSSSSSGSGGGYCSRSVSDDDDDDDDECLDDWETMADALEGSGTDEKPEEDQNVVLDKNNNPISMESCPNDETRPVSKSEPENGNPVNSRAWSSNDAFRPQCLPNLSKQYTFPMNSERHYHHHRKNAVVVSSDPPSSCPICFEDLDLTDSSFLPCPCGFRLCLFCHKRILEDDGRCPGCRKEYDRNLPKNTLSFRFARSCSLITRP